MSRLDRDHLNDLTRAELVERAREADVSGRSSMTKAELVDALASAAEPGVGGGSGSSGRVVLSRVDAFRRLAEARARGEMVLLPRHLTGEERRRHVRQTIREDHETRISKRDDDAAAKSPSCTARCSRSSAAPACSSTATWRARTPTCRPCSPSVTCTPRTSG